MRKISRFYVLRMEENLGRRLAIRVDLALKEKIKQQKQVVLAMIQQVFKHLQISSLK